MFFRMVIPPQSRSVTGAGVAGRDPPVCRGEAVWRLGREMQRDAAVEVRREHIASHRPDTALRIEPDRVQRLDSDAGPDVAPLAPTCPARIDIPRHAYGPEL